MHSVDVNIQSFTASQVAKRHLAQNLEMLCLGMRGILRLGTFRYPRDTQRS